MIFSKRIKLLQKKLKKNNVFAYLEIDETSRFYLTGFKGNPYPILFVDNKIYFFTSKMLYSQANNIFNENIIDVISIVISGENISNDLVFATILDALKYLKEKHKLINLYLSLPKIKFDFHNRLNNIFELVDDDNIVDDMRRIKDEEEISNIKIACEFSRELAKGIPNIITENITEFEFVKKMDMMIIENTGEKSFDTIVAFGKNSAYPHHFAGDTKYKKNDILLVDFGVKYKNYCSDLTRTICDKKDTKIFDIYKMVEEVQQKILDFVKPGLTAKQIDEKTRNLFKSWKMEEYFLHSTGHGVGLDIHEKPAIAKYDETIIKKNMIITIEPGLYVEGVGGVRIEDTILVTEKGCEILT